ncbi:MAG TPA: hypothetical protein VGO11_24560, partial [Chthoniobacteraceae bacterium]|nr:hypothetical protein [Chthoniobacteraceae bacterium]
LPKRNDTDNVQYIEQLFAIGNERFALTCPQPDETVEIKNVPKINSGAVFGMIKHYRENEPTGRLLHYQSGKWVELLTGIDSRPWYNTYDRPHLMTSAGLLIGSRYSGPWLVMRPQDKPPIHLDWTTNFPLSDARQFIADGEAQIRAVSSQGRMALALIEPPLRTSPLRCEEFTLDLALLGDAEGNLWGFRERKFSQWNGESWIDHDMPRGMGNSIGNARWWLDDRGRGWALFTGGKAAVCDLATGAWKVFGSWDEAFVAQLPGGMNLPNLNDPFLSPVYSVHGQIAYLTLENGFHYYDGKSWHRWENNEIGGQASVIDGGPFFEGEELCMPLSGATMAWDDSTKSWNRRDRKEPPKLTIKQHTEAPIPVPEGSPVEKPKSIAQDALGVTWFTSEDGKLYKAVGGRAIQVLADDEPNPFRYGWELTRPKIDPRGNVIFEQRNWYYPYHFILVKATQPLPKVTAKLKELAGDQARVQFSSDVQPPAEVWYSWQLDQGEWQLLQHRPDVLLRSLAPGPHRLQVRAYNAELGPARTPAAVDFTIEAPAKSDSAPAPK